MQAQADDGSTILIAILISLFLFLICREIVCWYFKVSKISKQLEDIKNLLQQMVDQRGGSK